MQPTEGRLVCTHCGHTTNRRKVLVTDTMVKALWNVCMWAKENGRHEFKRSEIGSVIKSISESATTNFGNWIYFGGILYRPQRDGKPLGKGFWGLNIERARDFFTGKYKIPKAVLISPNGKIEHEGETDINGIAKIDDFLNERGEFIVRYV